MVGILVVVVVGVVVTGIVPVLGVVLSSVDSLLSSVVGSTSSVVIALFSFCLSISQIASTCSAVGLKLCSVSCSTSSMVAYIKSTSSVDVLLCNFA